MNFETSVLIERPVEEVFDYVSDPITFPRWNSAVRSVERTSAGANGIGATYRMERDLPGGRAENVLEVVDAQRPTLLVIRTTSGPTHFSTATSWSRRGAGRGWRSRPRSSSEGSRERSARSPRGR